MATQQLPIADPEDRHRFIEVRGVVRKARILG